MRYGAFLKSILHSLAHPALEKIDVGALFGIIILVEAIAIIVCAHVYFASVFSPEMLR